MYIYSLNITIMKKLIFVSTLMLGCALYAIPSENFTTSLKNSTTVAVVNEVDTFCKLIQQGNFEAVKSMIEAGADVNKKSVGKTPLMYAARHNKAKIAKLLISNGADLTIKSDRGYTALQFAEMSKAHDAYKIIEAAINAQNIL